MQSNVLLDETILHGRYLVFGLGEESYGLEIACITEIVNMQNITPLPQMPECIKGIINLRGKVVPVMDLRTRFGMDIVAYTDWTCIIIVERNGAAAGLIVDHVLEVLTIDDGNCVPLSRTMASVQNKYLSAIGKIGNGLVLLLDCDKLLGDDDFEYTILQEDR